MEATDVLDNNLLFEIDHSYRDFNWKMTEFHLHNIYELFFLEEGTTTIIINDTIFDIEIYDVVLYKPNIYLKVPEADIPDHVFISRINFYSNILPKKQ